MLPFTIVTGALIVLGVVFLPPDSIYAILGMILLTSLFIFGLLRVTIKRRKYSVLGAIFVFSALLMNYFLGFNVINNLLLASFIMGLGFLLK